MVSSATGETETEAAGTAGASSFSSGLGAAYLAMGFAAGITGSSTGAGFSAWDGGVSFSGGKGKVLPVFCGALFLSALTSIFIVLRVPPYYQNCIKGSILFVAALTKMRKY